MSSSTCIEQRTDSLDLFGYPLAIRNRAYTNEVRLRGLLKPAYAGFVSLGANSIRQLH